MYCPKCKESFDEGSRRFCPTDGSRLVSEVAGTQRNQPGGIFASLLPKIEAIGDLDENLSDSPRPSLPARNEPVFFELDDPELELETKPKPSPPVFPLRPVPAERPITRKVQPFEIPAGHVDLRNADRDQGFLEEFDLDNPERLVGRTVKGRYRVSEFLGGDETGLAYLADDRIVEDRKVLVRILIEDDYDEIMSSVLAEERVSLSHFSHPNIPRLIDSGGFANGANFLVSEYFDALSVSDVLTIHGKFNPQRAARILRQAANALNEAHQEGIIHRDIRPENLIIDASGEIEHIKVVNFGSSSGEPNDDNIAYKAPEVLEDRIATVASDIYSLAVVAYEMLTGQVPFTGSGARDFVRGQSAGLSLMPTDIRPELPLSVNEIIDRGLAFNAADRFPKARDLGDALFASLSEPAQPVAVAGRNAVVVDEIATKPVAVPAAPPIQVAPRGNFISLEPVVTKSVAATVPALAMSEEPSWRNRSPEPPDTGSSWKLVLAAVGVLVIIAIIGFAWYFSADNPSVPEAQTGNVSNAGTSALASTEMPPLPRNVPQPANTNFYQNNKQDLKGELFRNFVGFTLFYPKDWKVNGPQNGSTPNTRGKFLDISQPDAGWSRERADAH